MPVPKKDTSASVLGMLSTAGTRHRPATSAEPEAEPETEARIVDLTPPEAPTEAGAPAQRPLPASEQAEAPEAAHSVPAALEAAAPPKSTEDNAPRTHRLDQATANNLRAGWLAARRRGELTISQLEYAGRIIALGLAAEARQLDK